ncbi:hypothetical protein [Aestuariivirga sp.]|uniref:hypothetical protein n=1 Tax=Aestuariivirga sp. TaxID=2650926 RepID=UPI003016D72A
MTLRERLQAWRYNYIPDHVIGEILSKRWADNAIPFLALVTVIAVFGTAIPGFFSPFSLLESTRQLGEFAIVVMGLTVVMLAGNAPTGMLRSETDVCVSFWLGAWALA